MKKFCLQMSETAIKPLDQLAKTRGITVQQALRAVIIPEWVSEYRRREHDSSTVRRHNPYSRRVRKDR